MLFLILTTFGFCAEFAAYQDALSLGLVKRNCEADKGGITTTIKLAIKLTIKLES